MRPSIIQLMTKRSWLPGLLFISCCSGSESYKLPVRITWGHSRPAASSYFVKPETDRGMTMGAVRSVQMEPGETAQNSHAGGGDIDGIEFVLDCPPREEPKLQ